MRVYKTLMSELLVHCFVVVLLTGAAFLAFFYPPGDRMTYWGTYEPLRGAWRPREGADPLASDRHRAVVTSFT
ncbi:hypothetical protein [Nonomuraea sp. SBT364]|uniref:hypothetical protein n=1 Tax=Nonomuraea sp. SBT364 TaxID=1580530 RepID=UPI00066C28A7|nr:hypothetical protein [Nonomuraea sp. SBT364]